MPEGTSGVASEIASVFFPIVKTMKLSLLSKQFEVKSIVGAGKDKKEEKPDSSGWSAGKEHLYGEATQSAVAALRKSEIPDDIIGVVVDQTDTLPVVISTENSVFPSPSPEKEGYLKGGWIMIALFPTEMKGDAAGFVKISLEYTKLDGTLGRFEKDVDLTEAEKKSKDTKNWASSEGMEKAMVLMQYVDGVKAVLADSDVKEFPSDFLDWFNDRVCKYGLEKEKTVIEQISNIIKKQSP